ncbi:hypothetical protein, partial [Corallococcus sp. AB049A]|uniref:hypothetical protein n=1 Tax=Corallococcus sp. AB049A TaxID=2316721 RepID=UPI0011C43F89
MYPLQKNYQYHPVALTLATIIERLTLPPPRRMRQWNSTTALALWLDALGTLTWAEQDCEVLALRQSGAVLPTFAAPALANSKRRSYS